MKTVTMDFETYEKEIIQAKLEGSKLGKQLRDKLNLVLPRFRTSSRDEFEKAYFELYEIVESIPVVSNDQR